MELVFEGFINIMIVILNIIGLFIILQGAIVVFAKYTKNKFDYKDENLGVELAQAMALGLQFMLAAEIINTLILDSLKNFWLLGAITAMRIIIGLVLHWEIKNH